MHPHFRLKRGQRIETVSISRQVFEHMAQRVLSQRPNEVCGFLLGDIRNTASLVRRVRWIQNISDSPDRFAVDLSEVNSIVSQTDGGEEVVAFFHSHAGRPEPSPADRVCMRFIPAVWVILGQNESDNPAEWELSAACLRRKQIRPVQILI